MCGLCACFCRRECIWDMCKMDFTHLSQRLFGLSYISLWFSLFFSSMATLIVRSELNVLVILSHSRPVLQHCLSDKRLESLDMYQNSLFISLTWFLMEKGILWFLIAACVRELRKRRRKNKSWVWWTKKKKTLRWHWNSSGAFICQRIDISERAPLRSHSEFQGLFFEVLVRFGVRYSLLTAVTTVQKGRGKFASERID